MSDIDEAADPAALIEAYYERGLDRRPAGRAAVGRAPSRRCWPRRGSTAPRSWARSPGRNAVVSAEKAAINAVMAGCRPEYMPVVVAAVKSLCAPAFAYHGPASSTGGSAMALVVNGPIARAARHQQRQQRVRPGPPAQRHHRPRGAPHHDERDEHAPGPARPRHARQSRQVHLLLRGARGGSPVGAAARRRAACGARTARSP